MAVSGTSSFTATRNELIDQAAGLLNVVATGQTMGAAVRNDFAFALNAMIKRWQATPGAHVWTTARGTLFPQPGQVRYTAGPGSTDHITEVYYETAATVDAVIAATAIDVEDTTNVTIGDFVGIVLDDGTLQWETVTGKTASSISFAPAGLDDTVAIGNAVFTYTSKIVKPLKVVEAQRYDIDGQTDTPISVISRKEYYDLPNKQNIDAITEMFYDPQRTTGIFHLWGVPAATTELLNFTWYRPLMDFTNPTDNPDFPQEWIQTIVFNLAKIQMIKYPVPPQKERMITNMADQFFADLMGFDRENESITIQPDFG